MTLQFFLSEGAFEGTTNSFLGNLHVCVWVPATAGVRIDYLKSVLTFSLCPSFSNPSVGGIVCCDPRQSFSLEPVSIIFPVVAAYFSH